MPRSSKPVAANLTLVAQFARSFFKYGVISLIVLMVGRVVVNTSTTIWKAMHPPKPAGPTLGFGTLPPIVFPDSVAKPTTITRQTRTGGFGSSPKVLPVFFMPSPEINLLSLDRAKKEAAGLNFVFNEEQVSPTLYRWKRRAPLPAVLEIDTLTQNFSMKSDWASDADFLSQLNLPDEQGVTQLSKMLLNSAGLMSPDLASSEAKVTFLKSRGNELTPAASYSEAEFVQVDIARTPIDLQYPIVRNNPKVGSVRMVFSGTNGTTNLLIEGEFVHPEIDYSRRETYPIFTPEQAWQQLQAGEGFIASLKPGIEAPVVRDAYLGYFDGDAAQTYLQPVYVFTGDDDFVAYVPAINPAAPVEK